MKPIRKRIFVGSLAVFAAIQFIRPTENLGPAPGGADFIVKAALPPDAAQLLAGACYDCHSDHTRYPWYAEIEPVGWWLGHHIEHGKERANFSEFGILSRKKQTDLLDNAVDAVNHDSMPPWTYRLTHPAARLDDKEKTLLTAWFQRAADAAALPPKG